MSTENQTQDPASSVLRPHPSHKLLGGVLLILVILWAAYGSGDIRIFIDQNSMIFVLGITFTGLWMCFGPLAVFHAIKHALLDGKTASPPQLSRDITVMGRAYQLAWASVVSSLVWSSCSATWMIRPPSDPAWRWLY